MYPKIIDKIGIKHQLCIFHIIKNHHNPVFKNIRRLSKRIRTIGNHIADKKQLIEIKTEESKKENISSKKKSRLKNKIKNLNNEIRKLRKERREKKAKLKELLKTNECVENIYNADDKKVTWTTSNSSIVSVFNGRITAEKVGTATITATNWDGQKKSAVVTVKFRAPSEGSTSTSWRSQPGIVPE